MSRAGLELPPGRVPDAIALVVVAVIVEHDDGDRRLVARHAPQRLRAGEAEAAVADHRHHRHVGPRQLDAERRRHAPAQHVRAGAEILLVVAAERHQRVHGLSGIDVGDVAGVAVEIGFELEPEPLHADRRRVGEPARDRLPRIRHLRRVGARACAARCSAISLSRDAVAMLRIAAVRSAMASRRSATMARSTGALRARLVGSSRIEISLVPGAADLAPAIAEVEQHVGLARIAHGAQMRADEQRMPGRERLRPIAEHCPSRRRPAAPSSSASSINSFWPRHQVIFVADADQRVLRLDQHARRLLDVVLVGTDAHRHVELAALPDLRLGAAVQRIGRQRQEHRAARRRRGEFHAAPRGLGDRRGRSAPASTIW